jgi:soluble epoxide hydrolase/lipid-phosphate phosphatase
VIPQSAYTIEKPVFLGLTEKDPLCVPVIFKALASQFCKNVTTKLFSCGHWIFWEKKDQLSEELAVWVETLGR